MPQRSLHVIALVSLAGLALEISLTRLVSVLFFPPAVFAILSLAILGIGLGAALVTWRKRWRHSRLVPLYLSAAALAVAGLAAVVTIPQVQIALFGLAILPYLFIGMALATLFSAAPERSTQLYFADLLGAGLGALLAVPLLNWLGGLDAVLVIAILLAVASLLIYSPQGREGGSSHASKKESQRSALALIGPALLIATLFLLLGSLLFGWLAVDMSQLPAGKPITEALDGPDSTVVATKWNAFARTDLVDPGDGGPYRLYMDGAAGSVMPPAANNEFLWQDIGLFPFATEQPQQVFLIGPGGGLDVWFALQGGAEVINAVEVNGDSVELVREHAAYNGDLYGDDRVSIFIDDGRSLLKRTQAAYDLIFMSQLVTLAAERSGYTLVENSSYTVEAFNDYLDHLAPGGQISLKLYDEPTLTRALSTALAAFRSRGLSDQEGLQHVIVLLDGRAQPPVPLLIIGKEPFSPDDVMSLGAVAQQVGFTPLFLPGAVAQPPLDGVAAGEASFSEVIAGSENDLSPTTDDRPFFFQFERGIPQALQPLLWGAGVLLAVGTILVILHQRAAPPSGDKRWRAAAPFYFAGLGLGFIMVEIGVIQEIRLFLGHPTVAITVGLATLLISGGLGSALAGRWVGKQAGEDSQALRSVPIVAVIVILGLWMLLWPWLQELAGSAQPIIRLLVVIASLLPLGLAMGMPFPLGLRAVGRWGEDQVALGWAVNGVLSVVGSLLAVTLAVKLGFTAVLLAGAAAYALAAAAAAVIKPRHSDMVSSSSE